LPWHTSGSIVIRESSSFTSETMLAHETNRKRGGVR
jgi:hypothetical protein